ncbi:hypothetical protein [Halobacteriovorax sp.]|uniref:hypothetical protein n=1 Tax=Halobacteriovorax sp. TaxID=2020862 RepID=UPI003568500A
MRNIILIGLLFISTNSFANSRGQVIDNISRLSSRIQLKVLDSQASVQELRIIQNNLKSILDKLDNRPDNRCLDFALQVYESSYSGTFALKKAKEACERISDVGIVKFVYEIYSQSYSEVFALERAIDKVQGHDYFGKSDELMFIYSAYEQDYSSSFAIDRALEKVELLDSDSMNCLEVTYKTLSRSYSPKFAMDRSVESCR